MTLLTLLLLVFRLPTIPFARCPECQTIFYRVRKQVYCTRQCVHRANVRKWRQTPKGGRYERQRSRARYEARVRRQTSSRVRVNTRTRQGEPRKGG